MAHPAGADEHPSRSSGSIVASGVWRTFPDRTGSGELVAVTGVDLDVAPGEFVSLVGPSGCGKSTLLMTGRAPADDDRRRAHRRQPRHRPSPFRGPHVPDARAVPLAQRPRERAAARGHLRLGPARSTSNGRGPCSASWASRSFEQAHRLRALGRHAAAHRALPRAHGRPRHHPHGRALRRARRVHPRAPEPRAAADLGGDGQDHRVRHPQHLRGRLPLFAGGRHEHQPRSHPAHRRCRPRAAAIVRGARASASTTSASSRSGSCWESGDERDRDRSPDAAADAEALEAARGRALAARAGGPARGVGVRQREPHHLADRAPQPLVRGRCAGAAGDRGLLPGAPPHDRHRDGRGVPARQRGRLRDGRLPRAHPPGTPCLLPVHGHLPGDADDRAGSGHRHLVRVRHRVEGRGRRDDSLLRRPRQHPRGHGRRPSQRHAAHAVAGSVRGGRSSSCSSCPRRCRTSSPA